jgi:hypothetical protein
LIVAFRIGQKVVCVDGTRRNGGYGWEIMPVRGQVYTIRGFDGDRHDGCGVWLEEIVNRPDRYLGDNNREVFGEVSFGIRRFRPVVDISDLQAIVREQLIGKPRTIKPDRFDKQRIHSSTVPPVDAASQAAAASVDPTAGAAPIRTASPVLPSVSSGDAKLAAGVV